MEMNASLVTSIHWPCFCLPGSQETNPVHLSLSSLKYLSIRYQGPRPPTHLLHDMPGFISISVRYGFMSPHLYKLSSLALSKCLTQMAPLPIPMVRPVHSRARLSEAHLQGYRSCWDSPSKDPDEEAWSKK